MYIAKEIKRDGFGGYNVGSKKFLPITRSRDINQCLGKIEPGRRLWPTIETTLTGDC